MLTEAFAGAVILVAVSLSLRVVREGERLGVVRLGRFVGMRGPGLVFTIPFADKATRIDLERDIPTWRSMPTDGLEREVERLCQSRGLGV